MKTSPWKHSLALLPMLGAFAQAETGPCDIYQDAGTPCVAAHSTTRALFAAYSGSLYQVRRGSDGALKDVGPLAPGGIADVSVQDAFCAGTTCTISRLYDQTANGNDLVKSPKAYWLKDGGKEANAADGQTVAGGKTVHGIAVTAWSGIGYRNNATKGVATGNQAESMYMVVDGTKYSDQCCFDYGNAETTGNDDGNGTMEALYWGSDVGWGGYGMGAGPWVAADLENGMFKGNAGGWGYGDSHKTPWPTAQTVSAKYVTAMLKGPSTDTFVLKAGDAQSGSLVTMWNGPRPTPGYSPKTLQGAIILGTGGDGSNGGAGIFFEGVMTKGVPPDATDDAIHANIKAVGYGRSLGATCYQYANYGGQNATLGLGNYTLAQLNAASIPDNAIASIKLDPGVTVELFDGDNFQTPLGTFTSSLTDLSSLSIANKVTSLRVVKATTTTVAHRDFGSGATFRYVHGSVEASSLFSGHARIIDARGTAREVTFVAGRGETGNLPAGMYRILMRDGQESAAFAVVPGL
jgi:Alpha-L-arabinofuranosidase B, catalytic